MADLPSILGALAQGFIDFGKAGVDLFGTGGAAIGDLAESIQTGKVTNRRQDDFRKWLYNTDDTQDAAAKGLGTALNGVQTVTDYIPGIGAVTRNPLFNAGQGALGGLADEFKTYGKDYDLGRAAQRAAVSAGGALASTGLADALKGSSNNLLKSATAQGLARGAVGGAISGGGYAAIDGGDVLQSALQGAKTGALIGGATGVIQDFKPAKTYDVALTDEEKASRIANARNMLANEQNPERIAELNAQIKRLGGDTLDTVLAADDMAVNSPKLTPEQEAYFKDSVMRDSNGSLMPVYHSSPNKFTEFDDARLGDNTAYDNTAFGHFVTNDRDFSSRFRDIDNRGIDGYTMELYADVKNPITHPYQASGKYQGADLDNIVKRYYEATDNPEALAAIKDWADESGQSLYEAYMDMTVDENPFDAAAAERDLLRNKGYDAVEFVEGLKNELVDDSTDKTPVSSYAVFNGNQLKDINNLAPTDDVDIMASLDVPEGFTYDYDGPDMAAVRRAYDLATQDQAKLDSMLKEISDTLGTEFSSAGQKSMESMLNKVDRKVRAGKDYTVASMKDHTRGKVMMNSFSDIPQVLGELEKRGIPYETEVVTNDWGYKGYHITFRNPDGISSEIQLTTADHWPAKLKSDAIYDKWRNVNLGTASEAEQRRYNEAMAESQALWAKVDFSEFDKAAQLSSGTGRASRSVAPVTSKSGLTQEPSLYKNTPFPSESANMSPSSVTRTFSGLGFDRSPNINAPPFEDIIPRSAKNTLEGVLAADDAAVNGAIESRVAPGQLGLFDDVPTQTPKTGTRQTSLFDQPQEGVDYYGSDIEGPTVEPANPYAPVGGQVTQAMRDRAADILGNWKKNGVPENELYNAIDPATLPAGYEKAIDILDNTDTKKYLKEKIGTTDIKKAKFDKVLDYLYGDNESAKRAYSDMRNQEIAKAKAKAELLGLPEPSSKYVTPTEGRLREEVGYRVAKEIRGSLDDAMMGDDGIVRPETRKNIERLDPKKHSFRTGYTAAADEALSERLGIAPGNTPKYNGPMDTRGAYGRYQRPFYGAGGDVAVFERKMSSPEDAISAMAHERLHSFQNEAGNIENQTGRYSKEVQDAYEELHKDLQTFKKTPQETAKRYGRSQYWQRDKEQEARMLEVYLENRGYAEAPSMNNKYRKGEWGNEINPAFDKFFDKLRDLSKRGVALPAITALLGGGAYMASQDKDKEAK